MLLAHFQIFYIGIVGTEIFFKRSHRIAHAHDPGTAQDQLLHKRIQPNGNGQQQAQQRHHQNQLPGGYALFDTINHRLGYIGGNNGLEYQCRHPDQKVQQTFFVPGDPVFQHILYVRSHNSSLPKNQNRPCIDLYKGWMTVFGMGTDFSF